MEQWSKTCENEHFYLMYKAMKFSSYIDKTNICLPVESKVIRDMTFNLTF